MSRILSLVFFSYLLIPAVAGTGEPLTGIVPESVPFSIEKELLTRPEKGLEELAEWLGKGSDSPTTTVRRIRDWIVMKIGFVPEFDDTHPADIHGFDRVLKSGQGNAGDIASLFKELCRKNGIEAEVVHGITKRFSLDGGETSPHVWNIVTIDDRDFLVDAALDIWGRDNQPMTGPASLFYDDQLFADPAAKIAGEYPDDRRYQLLKREHRREEFLGMKRWRADYFSLPVRFLGSAGGETAEPAGTLVRSSDETAPLPLRDRYLLPDGTITFYFSGGGNLQFSVQLFDPGGDRFDDYAYTYAEENRSVCTFSLPGGGRYRAVISARTRDGNRAWLPLYDCDIEGEVQGPRLPLPGIIRFTPMWDEYGLELMLGSTGLTRDGRLFSFAVKNRKNAMLYTEMRDSGGRRLDGRVMTSYSGQDTVQFQCVSFVQECVLVSLFAHDPSSGERAAKVLEFRFANLYSGEYPDIPAGEIHFSAEYYQSGIRYLSDNIGRALDEGYYHLSLEVPDSLFLHCGSAAPGEREPDNFCIYERHGQVYDFYFLPHPEFDTTGTVYITEDGSEKNVVRLLVPASISDREYVHDPGWIYRLNGYTRYGLEVMYENLQKEESPGYGHIIIGKPENVSLFATCSDSAGRDISRSSVVASYPSSREQAFFFRLQPDSPVRVTVWAKNDEKEETYTRRALSFIMAPVSTPATVPPAGEAVFSYDFLRLGFSLADSNLHLGDSSKEDFITIQAPESYRVGCRVEDAQGENIPDAFRFSIRNDQYTFRFPAGAVREPRLVRITGVDSRGVETEICRIYLETQ